MECMDSATDVVQMSFVSKHHHAAVFASPGHWNWVQTFVESYRSEQGNRFHDHGLSLVDVYEQLRTFRTNGLSCTLDSKLLCTVVGGVSEFKFFRKLCYFKMWDADADAEPEEWEDQDDSNFGSHDDINIEFKDKSGAMGIGRHKTHICLEFTSDVLHLPFRLIMTCLEDVDTGTCGGYDDCAIVGLRRAGNKMHPVEFVSWAGAFGDYANTSGGWAPLGQTRMDINTAGLKYIMKQHRVAADGKTIYEKMLLVCKELAPVIEFLKSVEPAEGLFFSSFGERAEKLIGLVMDGRGKNDYIREADDVPYFGPGSDSDSGDENAEGILKVQYSTDPRKL